LTNIIIEIIFLYDTQAEFYEKYDRFEEAANCLEQSLALKQSIFGNAHLSVVQNLGNLAKLYFKQGKIDESEKLYQQALEIRYTSFL
jgi:tetratricopeptide (TPR) repeat protein